MEKNWHRNTSRAMFGGHVYIFVREHPHLAYPMKEDAHAIAF